MALKNEAGNYLIVKGNYRKTIVAKVYKNEEHRNSGDDDFVTSRMFDVSKETNKAFKNANEDVSTYNLGKTLKNNLKTISYDILKLNECEGWIDC